MTEAGDAPLTEISHPRETVDLFGHQDAERRLLDAWGSARFPHGWLITGPPGIGKATLAFRVARFVLNSSTETTPAVEADGPDMFGGLIADAPPGDADAATGAASLAVPSDSAVFKQIASGAHPDLRYLTIEEGKKQISAESVRAIKEFSYRTASGGGWKVIIVDGAETMSEQAANALLKPLEEPPSKALFLLISHAPGRLLPTIRSRCRMLKLSALSETDIGQILQAQLPGLPSEEAGALARLANGQAGLAVQYAAQGGLDLYRGFLQLLSTPDRIDREKLFKLSDELNKRGAEETFHVFRDIVMSWLRTNVVARARGHMPSEILPGDHAIAESIFATGTPQKWLDAIDEIGTMLAKADAPANLGRKHVLLSAFILLERSAKAG